MASLSSGCVRQIYQDARPARPIVQLLDVKKISHPQSGERFRLIISDGQHYTQGMLSTQSAFLVNSSQIIKHSIVQLEEYMLNTIQNKKIVIVLRCTVLQKDAPAIGQPTNMADAAGVPPAPAPASGGFGGGSFGGGHRAQPPPVPPPQAMGGGWGGRPGGSFNAPPGARDGNFQPITALNPYQNGWRIKARVTSKSNIRHWKNARGEGKLFSVDLLDAEGGEMRATMFNNACDKFYGILEVNKVYAISKGVVKMARKQFTHLKNDYEMTLNEDAEVTPLGDDSNIDNQRYNFVKIQDIANVAPNSYVDVLGIVLSVQPISKVMSQKTQKELDKRSIVLGDDTATIEMTLWNEQAIEYDEKTFEDKPVIAIRGARVSDFGGRSLSAGAAPPAIWPERKEAQELQRWFTASGGIDGGALRGVQSLTSVGGGGIGSANAPLKTFAEVKEEEIGMHIDENEKKAEYFSVTAWITTMSNSPDRPPWYFACPEPDNNFKVVDDGNGRFFCEKNNKVYSTYEPRYILRFQCMDFSGQQWMSAFHDVSERLLEVPCREAEQKRNSDPEGFNRIFADQTFKRLTFKCRAKCDSSYQDEVRLRVDAVDFEEVDPVAKSKYLLENIRELMAARQHRY